MSEVVDKFRDYYSFLPEFLIGQVWGVLAFICIVSSCYIFLFRKGAPLSWRGVAAYLYPSNLYKLDNIRADIWNALLHLAFFIPVLVFLGKILTVELAYNLLEANLGARPSVLASTWVIVLVQFLCVVLVREVLHYSIHYLQHKVPLLWSFHRLHHSSENLNYLMTFRNHPVDSLILVFVKSGLGGLVIAAMFYLLGAPLDPATVAILAAHNVIFGGAVNVLLSHSHVPISFGKLNYILIAPVTHQIHHSAELRHRDRNFGDDFAIFDWMFGTLYIPGKEESYRWGLNAEEIGDANPHRSVRGFYFEPFRYAQRTKKVRSPARFDGHRP